MADASLRKRMQINKAGRNMFITVAIASAIISVCIVLSAILVKRIIFVGGVVAEKSKTLDTLRSNNTAVKTLKTNIQELNSNQALIDSKIKNSNEEAVQVVLDALPSEANSLALGSSLQNVLLNMPDTSIALENLTVNPVGGVESGVDSSLTVAAAGNTNALPITFSFAVSGKLADLILVMERLEKSIRPINTTNIKLEFQHDDFLLLTVKGMSYYQTEKSIELQTKVKTQ